MVHPGRLRGGGLRHSRWFPVRAFLLIVTVGVALFVPASDVTAAGPEEVGSWSAIRDWPVYGKHVSLMHNGKVLLFSIGSNVHVWDPVTETFTPRPATFGDLHCAGHATLADGKVMVIGGVNVDPFVGIKVAATFDPATESWTQRTPMRYARWYPTATTLPDGRLLATGGTDEGKVKVPIPEVYDPAADTWTTLTGISKARPLYPLTFVLPSGKVYDSGYTSDTWLLDVAGAGSAVAGPTNSWANTTGGCCSESAAMYEPGKIIRAGGGDPGYARTAIVDMNAASPQWQETTPMNFPRRRHTLVLLADGTVMTVGGTRGADDPTKAVLETEIWDPATKTWKITASLDRPRMYHSTALLLPDGRVLATGGDQPANVYRTAQIYSPPYLYKTSRPAITAAPDSAAYGSTFAVDTDTSDISSVALLRPGSVTHLFDMNQRYVPLTYTQSGGSLSVTAPASGNIAPPGYYMLVVENAAGVPSVSSWIRLSAGGGEPPPPPPPPPPPEELTASFTATPTSGTAPLKVSFTDSSSGSPSTYEWDFQNDGIVDSNAQNPQFEYASVGTYSVKLTVRDASGASDDELKTSLVTATADAPPGATVTFPSVADAYVQSNVTTNRGTSTKLNLDGSPKSNGYLRFDVSGVSGAVTRATLQVVGGMVSSAGVDVRGVADPFWGEATIVYANAPALSPLVTDSSGSYAAGASIELDVTSLVTGNGPVSFGLTTPSSTNTSVYAREGGAAFAPKLVVESGGGEPPPPPPPSPPPPPPPLPIADFTASPTSGTAPLTVQFTNASQNATSWAWDFQNDQSFESTEPNPSFTFTQPGVYTVRLQIEGEAGGDEEIKTGYVAVLEAPPPVGGTFTFTPVADAKVRSTNPNTNYGTIPDLQLRLGDASNPITFRSFVKFTVSGIGGPPLKATLRLYVTDQSPQSGSVFSVANSWTETGVVWNLAPTLGAQLSAGGAAPLNTWKEFDVTAAITGDGTYSFALKEMHSDSVFYSSREGANKPQLVVTMPEGGPGVASGTHHH